MTVKPSRAVILNTTNATLSPVDGLSWIDAAKTELTCPPERVGRWASVRSPASKINSKITHDSIGVIVKVRISLRGDSYRQPLAAWATA